MGLLKATYKKMTASGKVFEGRGQLVGVLIAGDDVNNPTVSLCEGTAFAAAKEIVPTVKQKASNLGWVGFMLGGATIDLDGLHLTLTTAGSAELIFYYREGHLRSEVK